MHICCQCRFLPCLALGMLVWSSMACYSELSSSSDSPDESLQESSAWFDQLPDSVRAAVLWSADMEEGTLYDWTYDDFEHAGGGIFNTGGDEVGVRATNEAAHSGGYSAETFITRAIRSSNGDKAVRLMRWTDTPWDNGGEYFPEEAYFSTWMYFPEVYNPNKYEPWDPGDGGWWNVFQFKSDDASGTSQPLWVLNVDHDDHSREMYFYLYSKWNQPGSYGQADRRTIAAGEWVHVEARYVQAANGRGSITIWQNGHRILAISNVVTKLAEPIHWGIGNYTDHISGGPEEGAATIYFDDAAVSSLPLHPHR